MPPAAPTGVSMALWAKFGACGAVNETGRPVGRDSQRRRSSATTTLSQRRVSDCHGSVSPMQAWNAPGYCGRTNGIRLVDDLAGCPQFLPETALGRVPRLDQRNLSTVRELEAVHWPFEEILAYGTTFTSRIRHRHYRRHRRLAPSTSESPRHLPCSLACEVPPQHEPHPDVCQPIPDVG